MISRRSLLSLGLVLLLVQVVHARVLQDSASEDEDTRRARPQCAEYLSDKTFKPDGGDWKRRYNSVSDCFDNCNYEDYDVIVWNAGDSRCFCWDKDDGKWESAGDSGDVAYDLTPCTADDNRRRGRNPESEEGEDPDSADDSDDKSEDSQDDGRGRPGNRGGSLGWFGRPNRPRPDRGGGDGDDDDSTSSRDESEDSEDSGGNNRDWRASDVPGCAIERRYRTFKPRDGKSWTRKYDGLDKCFDRCFDDFEVIVWNGDDDVCYCWREENGQWDRNDGWDDVAFDLARCNRRNANDDSDDDSDDKSSEDTSRDDGKESSEDTSDDDSSEEEKRSKDDDSSEDEKSDDGDKSSEKDDTDDESSEKKKEESSEEKEEDESSEEEEKDDDDTTRAGNTVSVTANVPTCASMNDRRVFHPRANVVWPPAQYNNLNTCFQRCFDSFDFIIMDRQGRGCHCWAAADGWWEWPEWGTPADIVFDLRPCRTGAALGGGSFNLGFPATDPTRSNTVNPGTSWGSGNGFLTPIVGECGQSGWSQEWNVRNGMQCVGAPQKTIQTGFNVYYSFSGVPVSGNGVQMWRYDGTLEGCKRLFPMDQWNILLNGDIDIGSGSWMQWDSQTGECRLFLNNQACRALSQSQPAQTARYTTARYCQSSTSMLGAQG